MAQERCRDSTPIDGTDRDYSPKERDAASDERACDSIGSKRLLVTLYAVRYHCFDAELADLEKMSRDGIVNLALVYLGIGKRVDALDNLERALAADSQMMPWIGREPIFDPLRSEPRFAAFLHKMDANR